jgi:type I restriction-modification system DNA methylase subunit
MPPARRRNNDSAANLGFEARLLQAADALRNNMDAAEYKHVVLGLIFLKYISDAFEAKHAFGTKFQRIEQDRHEAKNPLYSPRHSLVQAHHARVARAG